MTRMDKLILVALLAPVGSITTVALAQNKAPEAQESQEKAGGQSLHTKVWWNQPKKVEELGLSEEQRGQMDALLSAYLDRRRESLDKQQEEMGKFGDALLRGDEGAAREHGDLVVEAATKPLSDQIEMMMDVAAVMTPEQREKLVSSYPRMLSRLWVLPGGGAMVRTRSGGSSE